MKISIDVLDPKTRKVVGTLLFDDRPDYPKTQAKKGMKRGKYNHRLCCLTFCEIGKGKKVMFVETGEMGAFAHLLRY